RGPRRQGDHRSEDATTEQFRADPPTSPAAGGRRWHEQDRATTGPKVGHGMLDPRQFRFRSWWDAVLEAPVVTQLFLAPVGDSEGRTANHGVEVLASVRVMPERVADSDLTRSVMQFEPESRDPRNRLVDVLTVRRGRAGTGRRAQQRPDATRRIEHGSTGNLGERHHEVGELHRGSTGASGWVLRVAGQQLIEDGRRANAAGCT